MTEFRYNDNEFARRRDLLGEVGAHFESHMQQYSGTAAVRFLPSTTLTRRYDVLPKIVSDVEWGKIHLDLAQSMPSYVQQINEREKDRLEGKLMRCRVSDNPVLAWQDRESSRNMYTGELRKGKKQQEITVIFSFPYTPPMR